ncbi:MAG TPA: hypothetical protein VHZ51_17510 [Ktedonobacteraceae bacterium]|nr:hypothetical protein [Ktedonobacteraceae bacterium]
MSCSRQAARASSLRSEARELSFFSRPAHSSDGSTHRRRAHQQAVLLLPELAIALQSGIWVRLQRRDFFGGPTGNRSHGDISCLSSLLELAFDRGS